MPPDLGAIGVVATARHRQLLSVKRVGVGVRRVFYGLEAVCVAEVRGRVGAGVGARHRQAQQRAEGRARARRARSEG